jgi:predicted short-subunit dehydrogenase-like oxidoreductase (DUF2520 family)
MISVVVIGSGNVAHHLISAFNNNETVNIVQVFVRNLEKGIENFPNEKITHSFSNLKEADVYLICVTDNAIASVSSQIPFKNKLVLHTSGSVPLNHLDSKNRKGVFYPLQTFSKSKTISFREIPICIEAEKEDDFALIEKIAKAITLKTYSIDSNQRKAIHVAAVFVCNFVNYLYTIGNSICEENKIPFEILEPLILETANKIKTLSPQEAQTGPAKRNDTETINSHLNFLTDTSQKEIYKILTKSIIDNGKKL